MTLEKTYQINASAGAFYQAITNGDIVSQWSGALAIMSEEEGGEFSLWGGSIVGVNKKVSLSQLSQEWKEKEWSSYSKVNFSWYEESSMLFVKLTHEDIPAGSFDDISLGWDEHYMKPLITWLESNNL